MSEDYDYDANGRLTQIVRDGKTLDLEHDAGDRLTEVENETNGSTIQYTYNGQGQRVAATQGTAQRQFLVAPAMGSGLASTDLIADGSGNLISNYVYAGGSSPFMRIGADGKPVYYLTDAMGSVIGLADGTGQSAAKFNYDSFGNLRSSSGAAASGGVAGGDFRFQGQWLEQGTGIYHFRARDYDASTGTFLSRDPVDIIETEPESFNPYQFVYNNPHVYSDPTGMYSMAELNTNMQIQGILNKFEAAVANQAKQYFVDRAKGVLGDIIHSSVSRLFPSYWGGIQDAIASHQPSEAGDIVEAMFERAFCGIFRGAGIANYLWLQPRVAIGNGKALTPGFTCNTNAQDREPPPGAILPRRGTTAIPDFIISAYSPTDDRPGHKDLIVGDFKYDADTLYKDYIEGRKRNQWEAIYKHAQYERGHQSVPITYFATLSGTTPARYHALKREATLRHVVMFVYALLDTRPSTRIP